MEASTSCCSPAGGDPGGVGKASPWIKPVAKQAAQKLKYWGVTDSNKSKITFVGHSLGTLMASEISAQLGNSANLIALDPPNEAQCGTGIVAGSPGRFNVENNTPRSEYRDQVKFVRAFHGKGSEAGSKWYALSAQDNNNLVKNDAIRIDYQFSSVGAGAIHGATQKTIQELFNDRQIKDRWLDEYDKTGYNFKLRENYNLINPTTWFDTFDGFKGDLFVGKGGVEKLEYVDTDGLKQVQTLKLN